MLPAVPSRPRRGGGGGGGARSPGRSQPGLSAMKRSSTSASASSCLHLTSVPTVHIQILDQSPAQRSKPVFSTMKYSESPAPAAACRLC